MTNKIKLNGFPNSWKTHPIFNNVKKVFNFCNVECGFVDLDSDIMFEELTIITDYSSHGDFSNIGADSTRDGLYKKLTDLGGCNGYPNNLSSFDFEECKSFSLFGDVYAVYYPKRNLIVSRFPPSRIHINEDYLNGFLWFYGELKKWVKSEKIKSVNLSEEIKKIPIRRFIEGVTILERDTKARIQNIDSTIHGKYIEVAELLNEKTLKIEVVKAYKGTGLDFETKIIEEVNEIRKLVFVEDVNFTAKGIEIKYKPINVEGVDLGVYTLYILPNQIDIENENPVEVNGDTFHHPHIEFGNICFGDSKKVVYELLGKMNFKKLAHAVKIYLSSVNHEDTYVSLESFGLARENGDYYETEEDNNGR